MFMVLPQGYVNSSLCYTQRNRDHLAGPFQGHHTRYYNESNVLVYFCMPHPANKTLSVFQVHVNDFYLSLLIEIEKKVMSYSIAVCQVPRPDLQ